MVNIKIKEIPKLDRPRERLIRKGSNSLSDAEVLAILLKTGTNNISAMDLAKEIIKRAGGLENLNNITYHELLKIKGIGEAKACLVLALIEFSKRINQKQREIIGERFINPEIVFLYYQNLKNLAQEHFYCLYLDNKKKIIKEKLLFVGTLNYSMVHPRDIFKEAFLLDAVSIICVHNHPSGDPTPSQSDYRATDRIYECTQMLGIELLDHIIIGDGIYESVIKNK